MQAEAQRGKHGASRRAACQNGEMSFLFPHFPRWPGDRPPLRSSGGGRSHWITEKGGEERSLPVESELGKHRESVMSLCGPETCKVLCIPSIIGQRCWLIGSNVVAVSGLLSGSGLLCQLQVPIFAA